MKVIKTKDMAALKLVFPLILEYMESEKCFETPDQFIMWLRVNLQNHLTCFWVALDEENNNKVVGYCVGVVQQLLGGTEILSIIQLFGHTTEIEEELWRVVKKWKIDYRIPSICCLTSNRERFEKFGMEVEEYKMVYKGE